MCIQRRCGWGFGVAYDEMQSAIPSNDKLHGASHNKDVRKGVTRMLSMHADDDRVDQGLGRASSSRCFHILKHESGQLKVSSFHSGNKVL
jgi:hypothetical protein